MAGSKKAYKLVKKFAASYGLDDVHGVILPINPSNPEVTNLLFELGNRPETLSRGESNLSFQGVYVRSGKNYGVEFDHSSPLISSMSREDPEYVERVLSGVVDLKNELHAEYHTFLKHKMKKYPGGYEKYKMDTLFDDRNILLILNGKKSDSEFTLGGFEVMKGTEFGFVAPYSETPDMLYCAFFGALQIGFNSLPLISFPKKAPAKIAAHYIYQLGKGEIDVAQRIDVLSVGDSNVGKTTIFRNLTGGTLVGIPSTQWYDLYAHTFELSEQSLAEYSGIVGSELDMTRLSATIWDLGGQLTFWQKLLGKTEPLPVKLLPEISKRKPHLIMLVYSADAPESLDTLREYASRVRTNLGERVYDSSRKVLFRTKTDLGGELSESEFSEIAASLGANNYVQVNALTDSEIIRGVLEREGVIAFSEWLEQTNRNSRV